MYTQNTQHITKDLKRLTMLKDRFACFSTLLIATRSLSTKLTLWVRLLTVSFIPLSLRSFCLWYPTRALFTSSKELWRYRISWSGNKSSCGIQLKMYTRQAGQQHWTTVFMSSYWSKLLFLVCTIDRLSLLCPSTLNRFQFTPSGVVWPQLDRRGKEGRGLPTWFTLWSQEAESLGINSPMFTSLAGRKACWVINWNVH